LKRLRFIRRAKGLGFTLEDIAAASVSDCDVARSSGPRSQARRRGSASAVESATGRTQTLIKACPHGRAEPVRHNALNAESDNADHNHSGRHGHGGHGGADRSVCGMTVKPVAAQAAWRWIPLLLGRLSRSSSPIRRWRRRQSPGGVSRRNALHLPDASRDPAMLEFAALRHGAPAGDAALDAERIGLTVPSFGGPAVSLACSGWRCSHRQTCCQPAGHGWS
jgi:hypothetical protein